MIYLDGFSGYGGFHLGLERAGFTFDKVYYSEINKYAIANYSYNFPNSIYAGSIDTICTNEEIKNIDFFTFGWPCQDNSIAGKRKGQTGGTRSGLLYEAVKILNKFKPRNFIAENVLGLLSVNEGIDIVESIRVLAYLNESCPQYDIEMQLLNTRWVLPQNRERLYFVGHLRGSGSRQIFPIDENSSRTIKGTTDTAIVRCLTAGGHSGGMHSGMTLLRWQKKDVGVVESEFSPALRASGGTDIRKKPMVRIGTYRTYKESNGLREMKDNICPALSSRPREDGSGQPIIQEGDIIRRLTPLEWERFQGLPDNWTEYGLFDGEIKSISDTRRYSLCGNGVSVPIVEMIGKKLYREPLI